MRLANALVGVLASSDIIILITIIIVTTFALPISRQEDRIGLALVPLSTLPPRPT